MTMYAILPPSLFLFDEQSKIRQSEETSLIFLLFIFIYFYFNVSQYLALDCHSSLISLLFCPVNGNQPKAISHIVLVERQLRSLLWLSLNVKSIFNVVFPDFFGEEGLLFAHLYQHSPHVLGRVPQVLYIRFPIKYYVIALIN